MRIARNLPSWMFAATMIVLLGWLSASPTRVQAQTGYNIVQTNPPAPIGTQASPSFIDASVYPGTDICTKIFNVLNGAYPPAGAVIDARGITGLTCATPGNTPWIRGNAVVSEPSHILLPAGTISIPTEWQLPKNTRITGEGRANTTISPTFMTGPILVMGDATCVPSSCFNISIEDLTLNGNNHPVDGIDNSFSQELSYVNNVSLTQIEGTGLNIASGASNSGPYSNIYFTAMTSAQPTTACAKIQANTRGLHGITCTTMTSPTPAAAVYLDGNSNTIEDFHVEGFEDGILVGDSTPAASNVLININGAKNDTVTVNNVIHISANNPSSDLAILGVHNSFANQTIQDDLTTTTITDASVAMYALGEPVGGVAGAYSRFTTSSTSTPTWGVGSGAPSPPCAVGSLYSNRAATSAGNTLYVCVQQTLAVAWMALTIP